MKKREEKNNEDDQKHGEIKKKSEKKVKIHEKMLQKTDVILKSEFTIEFNIFRCSTQSHKWV